MIKKLQLDENYSIELRKYEGGKQIWLIDNKLGHTKKLAFLTENYKWEDIDVEFFEIAKNYSSVFHWR